MKRGAMAATVLVAALGLLVGSVQGKTRERRRGGESESPETDERCVRVCQQPRTGRVVCTISQGLDGVIPLVCGGCHGRMRGLEGRRWGQRQTRLEECVSHMTVPLKDTKVPGHPSSQPMSCIHVRKKCLSPVCLLCVAWGDAGAGTTKGAGA